MEAAQITELRKELKNRPKEELLTFCLELSKFKKENKEFITYLVFEKENEQAYRKSVNKFTTRSFSDINTYNYYYIKKSVRRILRQIKRYIRYSKNKETEAELLLHFCREMLKLNPPIERNRVLKNMFDKQLEMAQKAILKLHPDLQYDYRLQIEEFTNK